MAILGSGSAEEFSETTQTRFDWTLFAVMLALIGMGFINIYSKTVGHFGDENIVLRQFFNLIVALVVLGIVMLVDYRLFERVAYFGYGLNLLALFLVPKFGVVRYGARRWIDLGFMNWQPAESMKLMAVLALARYFQTRVAPRSMGLLELAIPAAIVGLPALLTIAQPDLGTGGHLALTGFVMLLFVGIRPKILFSVAFIGIVSFPIFWKYGLKSYQKDRIITFLNPAENRQGEGYNAWQSLIAVGSGELLGQGFRKGTQTQLDFTPEGHTDFIFTVLSEEWGFVGVAILFILYLMLFYRCTQIAVQANDPFGAVLCVGVIGLLASQIFINISMVSGMFPIVGIPLPLLSYGGTALISAMVGLGMILNVGFRRSIF
jgi:rod shape determining protein RodA